MKNANQELFDMHLKQLARFLPFDLGLANTTKQLAKKGAIRINVYELTVYPEVEVDPAAVLVIVFVGIADENWLV